MSPKQKCHLNWNVTKTEMSLKLKCHQNFSGLSSYFVRTFRVWHWLPWPCYYLNWYLPWISLHTMFYTQGAGRHEGPALPCLAKPWPVSPQTGVSWSGFKQVQRARPIIKYWSDPSSCTGQTDQPVLARPINWYWPRPLTGTGHTH